MALLACEPNRASIGEACDDNGDCAAHLQCLQNACSPLCDNNAECGDGFTCTPDGLCEEIISSIGESCDRELDCGPGQTCRLADAPDDEHQLPATCQPDQAGGVTGSPCDDDSECRNHLCSLGHCTELCTTENDCPSGMGCAVMPRTKAANVPFHGCLQEGGTLSFDFHLASPHELLSVPVPNTARSFAVVARISNEQQLVGAASVYSPSGSQLYHTPNSEQEFYENALRHTPTQRISTLLIPNTPDVPLEQGVYEIEISSFLSTNLSVTGTAVPEVSVIYKLDDADRLDLHLRFLNLQDHPCAQAKDLDVIDAQSAQESNSFRLNFVEALRAIFAQANIEIGLVTYGDIPLRGDLDGLQKEDLPKLLELSDQPTGITIYFVRSITPAGIQAIAGGTPGPPRQPGTAASGIAVSYDTLCYRGWQDVARATAHEIGRYMGLYRNRQPDPDALWPDPIKDSPADTDNLMFYGEFGGRKLSEGQGAVLRLNPGLR